MLSAISATISLVLIWYAQRYKGKTNTRYFQALMLVAASWALLYGLEMSFSGWDEKLLFFHLRWVPQALIGVTIFCLAISYAGKDQWLTRRNLLLLTIIPAVTIVLALASPWSQLFKYDFSLSTNGPFVILSSTSGPWFLIYIVYSYILIAVSLIAIAMSVRGGKHLYRSQAVVFITGLSIGFLVDALFQAGALPTNGFNPSSSAISIGGIFLLWGLFQFRLLDLRPMARQMVVEELPDMVQVYDGQHRLVDFNRVTGEAFGLHGKASLGLPVEVVMAGQSEFVHRLKQEEEFRAELDLVNMGAEHSYEASVRSLAMGEDGKGRVVLLRDITDRRRVEDKLRASEGRYRDLVELAPFPIVITDRDSGKMVLVNKACIDLFDINPEDVKARTAREFYLHQEDRNDLLNSLRVGGPVIDHELQMRTSKGGVFWAHVRPPSSNSMVAIISSWRSMISMSANGQQRRFRWPTPSST